MDTAVREEGRAHNRQDKSRKRLSECAETLSLDLKPSMVDKDVHRSEGVVGRRGQKAWSEGVVAGEHSVQRCELVRSLLRIRTRTALRTCIASLVLTSARNSCKPF